MNKAQVRERVLWIVRGAHVRVCVVDRESVMDLVECGADEVVSIRTPALSRSHIIYTHTWDRTKRTHVCLCVCQSIDAQLPYMYVSQTFTDTSNGTYTRKHSHMSPPLSLDLCLSSCLINVWFVCDIGAFGPSTDTVFPSSLSEQMLNTFPQSVNVRTSLNKKLPTPKTYRSTCDTVNWQESNANVIKTQVRRL